MPAPIRTVNAALRIQRRKKRFTATHYNWRDDVSE